MTSAGIEFNPERPGIPANQAALERNAPVVIMFNPSGDIERIYVGWIGQRPLGSVHLLVGRVEQVNPPDVFAVGDDYVANLMDGENSWVSLGHRSGAVTSAENGPNTATNTAPQRLFESREFARSAIDRGSR